MNGVYIKGMEMPETCEDCNLESFCDLWVEARKMDGSCERSVNTEKYGVLKTRRATRRHPDCPLIEVPKHGRLIDVDAFVNRLDDGKSRNDFEIRGARRVINQLFFAPTIIPADFAEDTNVLSKEEGE